MFGFLKGTPSISTDELQQRLKGSLVLLDVRTPGEFQAGHIARAKNVPLNKIDHYQQKTDVAIYVICQSGMRSKQAAQKLQKQGYRVINVKGGMNQWRGPVRGGK